MSSGRGLTIESLVWRSSSLSQTGDGVEVALADGQVLVRNTADPQGEPLRLDPDAWKRFIHRTLG